MPTITIGERHRTTLADYIWSLKEKKIFHSMKLGPLKHMVNLILLKLVIVMGAQLKSISLWSILKKRNSQTPEMKYVLSVDIGRSFFWQTIGLFKKYFVMESLLCSKIFYGGIKNILKWFLKCFLHLTEDWQQIKTYFFVLSMKHCVSSFLCWFKIRIIMIDTSGIN